jgi:hypothetical protein
MSEQQQRAGSSKRGPAGRSSNGDKKNKGKGRPKHTPPQKITTGEEGVGVSKIKAALRQTKRLLAKVCAQ